MVCESSTVLPVDGLLFQVMVLSPQVVLETENACTVVEDAAVSPRLPYIRSFADPIVETPETSKRLYNSRVLS